MGAAVWDRASAPAPFKGAALIVALGALAALWLLGSDAAYDNIRVVSSVERINHDKLVHGAEMEILQGHSPLRTATGVESDIGNPYHQFYSPFAHLVMGLWSLLAGDIVLGTSLALFFFLVLGFVSAFALLKYLTRSPLWGIVGAFLSVRSPNLNVCRSTTGALAEYRAIRLSPLTYLAPTRAMTRPGFKRFVLAALAVSWPWLTHPLTAFRGLFFGGALLGIQFARAAWAAPMSALAALIIRVIPNPELIVGIKYLNTAQFTFRFLSYFQFLTLPMTVFALQTLCRRWGFAKIPKATLAAGVIFAALFLVKPYLYPASFPKGSPRS